MAGQLLLKLQQFFIAMAIKSPVMPSLLDNLSWLLGKTEDQKRVNPRLVALLFPPSKLYISTLKFATPCFGGNSLMKPISLWSPLAPYCVSFFFSLCLHLYLLSGPFQHFSDCILSSKQLNLPVNSLELFEDLSSLLITCFGCFYFSVMSIWSPPTEASYFLTAIYASSSPPQLHFSLCLFFLNFPILLKHLFSHIFQLSLLFLC